MKKTAKKTPDELPEKKAAKPKKEAKTGRAMEESESDDPEQGPSAVVKKGATDKTPKKKPAAEDDDDDAFDEEEMDEDDFYGSDEEFDVEDPDFEEFDLPKSGKGVAGKKKPGGSKDEFDDDFQDLGFFSDDAYLDDEDEDDF